MTPLLACLMISMHLALRTTLKERRSGLSISEPHWKMPPILTSNRLETDICWHGKIKMLTFWHTCWRTNIYYDYLVLLFEHDSSLFWSCAACKCPVGGTAVSVEHQTGCVCKTRAWGAYQPSKHSKCEDRIGEYTWYKTWISLSFFMAYNQISNKSSREAND